MDGQVIETAIPSREFVMDFERSLEAFAIDNNALIDPETLTRHWFAPGIYARELLIPAGTCLTGKIHRHEVLNICVGDISVLTEDGVKRMTGHHTLVSPAGIKRVGFAHADTLWTCIHANPDNCADLAALEARYIAPSFKELTMSNEQKVLP